MFIEAGLSGLAKELLTDFADSLPGIDEAKSFMQVMGYVVINYCEKKRKEVYTIHNSCMYVSIPA